jgi:hypothetical protein
MYYARIFSLLLLYTSSLIISAPQVSKAGSIVTSALPFTSEGLLVRTDTNSGATNVEESGVTLDDSNNLSGINTLTAATIIGTVSNTVSAIDFTGPLFGDVTGIQDATVVSLVGGVTAANVASGATAANAATSANDFGTIVQRDASGNFSATDITANITGSASNNVLLTGDSMSGALTMLDQAALEFQDSTAGNYVGIQAPTAVTSSYLLALPTTTPTAHQVIRANVTTPTNLEWITDGGSVLPASSQTIYVAKYGNDTMGDGSFTTPYASLAKAVNLANGIASTAHPVAILVGAGIYVENNSAGALAITASGISIIGESPIATIIMPSTPTNTLLSVTQTVLINRIAFQSSSPQATGISLTSGNLSNFNSVRFINFQTGVACSGSTSSYSFISCLFLANGTGLSLNNTSAECDECTITGALSLAGPPANTGISITGLSTNLVVNGGACGLCTTGLNVNGSAAFTANAVVFKRNAFAIVETTSAQMTLTGCTFEITTSPSNIDIQVSGASAEIIGCEFNGNSATNVPQATAIMITNNAVVDISGSGIQDFTTGLQVGMGTDTSSTILTASSLVIRNCATDLLQEGSTTLNFNAGTASSNAISINNPTNVSLAYFDLDNDSALTIGSLANINTPLLFAATSTSNTPSLDYQASLYTTQAIGLMNPAANATSWFVASNNAADLTAITTDRTQTAGVRLVSDTGSPVGGTTALRGWDINKNSSSAELSFNYQNTDTNGQASIVEYTVMQVSGIANELQFPNANTQIVFSGDTNLFRSAADVLATTSNVIVGPLTSGRVIITDPATNELSSSITKSTELSYLSGTTSSVQTQLNGKVAKAGDIMTGSLQLPAGTASAPSLKFTGGTNTTGISSPIVNTLSFDINGVERMNISASAITTAAKLIVSNGLCNQAIQAAIPANNTTVTAATTTSLLLLKPTSTVNNNFTIVFPASPTNGQYFTIILGTNFNVTLVNNGNGAAVVNGITVLTHASSGSSGSPSVTYVYYAPDATWYRERRG